MIGDFIYNIIGKYIFLDYLGLIQYKLSKYDNKFEKTKFNNLSGMRIPEIVMNIMSCHVFSKYPISTVILSYDSSLVQYYLNEIFFIAETEEGGPYNTPITVKDQINAVNLHKEDNLLTYKAEIPSIVKTLNKIIISRDIYDIDVSIFYDEHHV